MRINNNIMAMNIHRQLGMGTAAGARSTERLSSGMRINRAGDDAAGLAISEKMRAQIRGLNQASRNAQDGISLIQTAEGALKETHDILQRMRELAVQASNDTNVDVDREEIQKEINQLTSEINRIGNTTEFNTMTLLDGSRLAQSATDQTRTVIESKTYDVVAAVGVNSTAGDGVVPALSSSSGDNSITISVTDEIDWTNIDSDDETNEIVISRAGDNLTVSIEATDGDGNSIVITDEYVETDEDGNYVYNGHGIEFSISAEDFAAMADNTSIEIDLSAIADDLGSDDVTGAINTISTWTTNEDNDDDLSDAAIGDGIVVDGDAIMEAARSVQIEFDGIDYTVTINDAADGTGNNLSVDVITLADAETFEYNNHGISFTLTQSDAADLDLLIALDTEEVAVTEDNSLSLQVGANENQAIGLSLSDMRAEALGLSSSQTGTDGFTAGKTVSDGTDATTVEYALDVSSHEAASSAVSVISQALEDVSAERSMLGSMQNRLEHTIKNLDTSYENLQAAESRIRDVDMAQEMMEFTKNNILQQAGQAMLAQANQAPQGVLQLLG